MLLGANNEIRENISTVRVLYINEAEWVSLPRGGFARGIEEINESPPLPALHTVFIRLFIILTSRAPFRLSEHHRKTAIAQIPPYGGAIAIVAVGRNRHRPVLRIIIRPIVIKA